MKSFIYDDQDLLNKLFVLGQDKPQSQTELNNLALSAIDNLRSQFSALKASKNPTFPDIESLENFKNWAKTTGANSQGNLLLDPKTDRFNIPVLQTFLTDLRDRFASNADFSESLANLIDQANKSLRTNISLYPEKKKEEVADGQNPAATNEKPGPGGSKGMVGVKVEDQALPKPGEGENGQNQSPNGQQNPQQALKSVGLKNLTILNGRTIDVDAIYDDINTLIGGREGKGLYRIADPRTYQFLVQVGTKIRNLQAAFTTTTALTPNVNGIAISPSATEEPMTNTIKSSFNAGVVPSDQNQAHRLPAAYTSIELAKIAGLLAGIMEQIKAFYTGVEGIPMFANFPEIEAQITMANQYQQTLLQSQTQLSREYKSGPVNSIQ